MTTLREVEAASIRAFVAAHASLLVGRVLDYGCGRQPYRDLVIGDYHGYEDPELPGHVAPDDPATWIADPLRQRWDAILCTQVVQYVPDVLELIEQMNVALGGNSDRHRDPLGGVLVLTGPTCWPEVEVEDLHRFTQAGIRRLLNEAGFQQVEVSPRAYAPGCPSFLLGWGAVARA